MSHFSRYVGIDVAKDSLEIFIAPDALRLTASNDAAGWAVLFSHLQPGDAVGCEATGGFEAGLLVALTEAGIPAWCLHPSDVRAFCRLRGRRAKTDPLDAEAIAGALQVAAAERAPCRISRRIRDLNELCLVRRRLKILTSETRSLLATVHESTARAVLEDQLSRLESDIARLESTIAAAIAADEVLAQKAVRLRTAPGVGPVFAAELLASLPELGTLSSREVASLVGVAPHPRQSGNTVRSGRCHGGRATLRRVLYMAARAAVSRKHLPMRPFYDRLRAGGKPYKVAIVAVMRKLMVALNAMLKTGTDWRAAAP